MLELDDQAARQLHVRDVLLAVGSEVNLFVELDRKKLLPTPVPRSLVFPPWVAHAPAFVCPMPDEEVAALCDHFLVACLTETTQPRSGQRSDAIY